MIIIKDKHFFPAIVLGIIEKILIFLLFIFPLRAIKSVLNNSIGIKLEMVFSFLGIPINNQSDLIFIFSIIFILLLSCVILVNKYKTFYIDYLKNTKTKFNKSFSFKKNLRKLNEIDHHIDIRIFAGYASMLFIFLVFYDLSIASLIVFSGFVSFFQYRRLEKIIQKEKLLLEINKNSDLTVKEKYEKQFLLNQLITKYKDSKIIVKSITNTITMLFIMYNLFLREDKSSISIIFIFITRLCLNQIDQIISRYQRKKYKNVDLEF
mgnify:CR=1 FL=1